MKSLALAAVVAVLGACGGGPSVDIVGKEPAAQADDIANAICEQEADCGDISIECTSDSTTMTIDCIGTIEDLTYDACFAEQRPDILADLTACNFTEAQERELQSCINARLDQSCVTQAELDAYVAKIEAGNQDAELRPDLPECAGLEALFESCP